jgi:hypothetical protein
MRVDHEVAFLVDRDAFKWRRASWLPRMLLQFGEGIGDTRFGRWLYGLGFGAEREETGAG